MAVGDGVRKGGGSAAMWWRHWGLGSGGVRGFAGDGGAFPIGMKGPRNPSCGGHRRQGRRGRRRILDALMAEEEAHA